MIPIFLGIHLNVNTLKRENQMKFCQEATALDMKMRNKIKGAVYGFAIGDAMGATTEFMTREEIKEKYGEVHDLIGGGWMNLNPGEVTDDTQMSICIMYWITGSM